MKWLDLMLCQPLVVEHAQMRQRHQGTAGAVAAATASGCCEKKSGAAARVLYSGQQACKASVHLPQTPQIIIGRLHRQSLKCVALAVHPNRKVQCMQAAKQSMLQSMATAWNVQQSLQLCLIPGVVRSSPTGLYLSLTLPTEGSSSSCFTTAVILCCMTWSGTEGRCAKMACASKPARLRHSALAELPSAPASDACCTLDLKSQLHTGVVCREQHSSVAHKHAVLRTVKSLNCGLPQIPTFSLPSSLTF